jgi:arylsulfatase
MHADSEDADAIRGMDPEGEAHTYTLDVQFAVNPSHMVTGVEFRDGKIYEVDLEAGEAWTQEKYREMNERYQKNALAQLRLLAEQDKPFFLNYWPLFPLSFTRTDIAEFKTLNGGTIAETIVEVDTWVNAILEEVDNLGIAENTVIVIMGPIRSHLSWRQGRPPGRGRASKRLCSVERRHRTGQLCGGYYPCQRSFHDLRPLGQRV